jgi:putative FmdB family regulatory protein
VGRLESSLTEDVNVPLYEYACRKCSRQFEELVFGHATPVCPACHSTDVERLLSAFAVPHSEKSSSAPEGPCGTCGDPRGPGSCRMS